MRPGLVIPPSLSTVWGYKPDAQLLPADIYLRQVEDSEFMLCAGWRSKAGLLPTPTSTQAQKPGLGYFIFKADCRLMED
jgi:hypothetical protein